MSDEYVIRHCAPTLAGIKTGTIFRCNYVSKDELINDIRNLNKRLVCKGLRILPLKFSKKRALIYIFRPKKLSIDLTHKDAVPLLQKHGYNTENCDDCVVRLIQRLHYEKEFPHEIGLFLGYPPEDVYGFIKNRACNCKCVGYWKVYGDVEAAKKKFAQYNKCSKLYYEQWTKGKDIERLTVVC